MGEIGGEIGGAGEIRNLDWMEAGGAYLRRYPI
jgi:hypothetical protein